MAKLSRRCAICDARIGRYSRLCSKHKEEFKDELDSDWLKGLIDLTNYEYNVELRDVRAGVLSLEQVQRK